MKKTFRLLLYITILLLMSFPVSAQEFTINTADMKKFLFENNENVQVELAGLFDLEQYGDLFYDKLTGEISYALNSSTYVEIPEAIGATNIVSIGAKAFWGCSKIESIFIPDSVINIDDTAFDNSNIIIKCNHGSYAEKWAQDHNYVIEIIDKYNLTISDDQAIMVGEKAVIKATVMNGDSIVTDAQGIIWECTDTSIVKMNEVSDYYEILLEIEGINPGQTTIIAKKDNMEAKCNITVTDTDVDSDGIWDSWEKNGIDSDGDGNVNVDLPAMGSDPNKPDIFVEVDWMVKPQEKFLFIETSPGKSFKPSESAMREVWQSFQKHGINIHIDCGADSILDFAKNTNWGNMSCGNSIDYSKIFNVGEENSNWNRIVTDNIGNGRECVLV